MKVKLISMAVLAITFLGACNSSEKNKEQINTTETSKENLVLLGKHAKLVYPDFEAEVHYISDSTLHWKTVNAKGEVAEGDEKISYKQINHSQFFVNWIEQDGVTVSQIVDVEKGTVTVFLSYPDDKSVRGKRATDFIEGKWIAL